MAQTNQTEYIDKIRISTTASTSRASLSDILDMKSYNNNVTNWCVHRWCCSLGILESCYIDSTAAWEMAISNLEILVTQWVIILIVCIKFNSFHIKTITVNLILKGWLSSQSNFPLAHMCTGWLAKCQQVHIICTNHLLSSKSRCHHLGSQNGSNINPLNPAGRFYGFEVPLSDNRWKRWFSRYFSSIPDSYFVLRCLHNFFATGNDIWLPFCHFCHFLVTSWNLCSKVVFLVNKLVCFAISLDAILPE
jgi:hypothetical protein